MTGIYSCHTHTQGSAYVVQSELCAQSTIYVHVRWLSMQCVCVCAFLLSIHVGNDNMIADATMYVLVGKWKLMSCEDSS